MFDLLNGNNIQCFFTPVDMDDETLHIKYKTTRRKFELDEKLPYKSFAYDYSDNFVIFDYESDGDGIDSAWIHIIENGACIYYIPPTALDKSFPLVLVVNKYGIPLNIKNVSDFQKLQDDYEILNQKIKNIGYTKEGQAEINKLEKNFQFKWYNFKLLGQVNSNIVGIILSIVAVNQKFNAKYIFKKYCEKHNLNPDQEILKYYKWANLHSLSLTQEELEEILF